MSDKKEGITRASKNQKLFDKCEDCLDDKLAEQETKLEECYNKK